MASVSAWLLSFRLHTLPLSFSSIFVGSFLAAYHHSFNWLICITAIFTTLCLQILSNLANDFGDTESGVDNQERIGPKRSLQAGIITKKQMKYAIIIFIILSLLSGITLIIISTKEFISTKTILLFIIGIAAIMAAIKYTMGKNPYGYAGFGDLFVFIFFGLVGVLGTYFLYTHKINLIEFLPAISIGCFSTGVLNLNNLRDRINDAAFGKKTLVVRIGYQKAKYYHAILLIIGMLSTIFYTWHIASSPIKWLFVISFIGIIRSIIVVFKNDNPTSLYPELKLLSLSTLVFSILFGIGLIF
ncbi:MAG: 1,4-dihydroxy-2-naphthoate polyprenyltransferase [Chitinophagaceae bacterium]|nr:1,4-dihydroxy-2-naphthoate polyprenyltransferase [Chitinophagaceae bacterium]MCW5905174.1 1,4-dihydroxy-2-naphthoate polyprenyltransferase [Chitinophagaceae bacterium]